MRLSVAIFLFALCFITVSQTEARISFAGQWPFISWGGERQEIFDFGHRPCRPSSYPTRPPKDLSEAKVCNDCVCGSRKVNRIVNGEDASLRDFPWLVRIKARGNHHCGGTLITRRHVLTAAHCVYLLPDYYFSVFLADEQERKIKSIRAHRSYIKSGQKNDIAIIELTEPVTFGPRVRTICLPDQDAEFTGKTAIAAGWGYLVEGSQTTSIKLKKVELPIISNTACQNSKNRLLGIVIQDTNICAGGTYDKKDTCQGDSGGPLEVDENGRHVLAGVVSFGYGCARPDFPGMYTRVSKYLQWINDHIGDECLCPNSNNLFKQLIFKNF